MISLLSSPETIYSKRIYSKTEDKFNKGLSIAKKIRVAFDYKKINLKPDYRHNPYVLHNADIIELSSVNNKWVIRIYLWHDRDITWVFSYNGVETNEINDIYDTEYFIKKVKRKVSINSIKGDLPF